MSAHRSYLGEAIYADMNGAGDIILTVDGASQARQCIVLGPEVFTQLVRWVRSASERLKAEGAPRV